MEYYEVMFLLDINLPDDERRDIASEIKKELIDLGAEVDTSKQFDVRDLSYPIQNVNRADFRLIEFRAGAESLIVDDLRERLNFRDDIIRYLITNQRKDRHPDEVFESRDEEENQDESEEAEETDEEEVVETT